MMDYLLILQLLKAAILFILLLYVCRKQPCTLSYLYQNNPFRQCIFAIQCKGKSSSHENCNCCKHHRLV